MRTEVIAIKSYSDSGEYWVSLIRAKDNGKEVTVFVLTLNDLKKKP